jgi:hypothetical protein
VSDIPDPLEVRPIGRRTHVSYPGRLATVIGERIIELERGNFSTYAIELVCYDMRQRINHSITGQLARLSPAVQDAVDRQIIQNYRPYTRQRGEFIRSLVENAILAPVAPDSAPGHVGRECEWVAFPPLLRGIIAIRWRELGFRGISEYVTSVLRYDLLVGGRHVLFRGGDCTPEMCRALDFETLEIFHANVRSFTLADYIVQSAAGRKLTAEERNAALRQVGERLTQRAVEARKAKRHGAR